MANVIIAFADWAEYHVARLKACVSFGRHRYRGIELFGGFSSSAEYQWRAGERGGLPLQTLFPEEGWPTLRRSRRRVMDAVSQTIDSARPDVVFVPGYSSFALRHLATAARSVGAVTVLMTETRESDARRNPISETVKRAFVTHTFDAAIVGGTQAAAYAEQLGIPASRIWHGYDCVDNEYFRARAEAVRSIDPALRAALGLPSKYFLFVGRFERRKNVGGLLQAYARYLALERHSWGLVIAGGGPLETELRLTARHLGLENIVWAGFLTATALANYYALASALVVPSTQEPWGLVVNEGMAAGIPVIVSSRVGAGIDLVRQGVTGVVIPPDDVDALVQAMRSFMTFRDAPAMGRNASSAVDSVSPRKWVLSVDDCVDALVARNS